MPLSPKILRDLPRLLVSFTLGASTLVTPRSAVAAVVEPAVAEPADAEPPLDRDDEPPLDRDDEPPLDRDDEPPLDRDDEPLLDTDSQAALRDAELDTDSGAPLDDGYIPLRDSPEAQAARRWLAAGIASTVTGGLLLGGATAMGMTAPCDSRAGNNCFAEARDRAALTMGIPGGVLLLGGLTMTIVGSLQKRQLARGVRASVAGSRDQIGVLLFGRF